MSTRNQPDPTEPGPDTTQGRHRWGAADTALSPTTPQSPPPAPMQERGTLQIAPAVVEKIAGQAVREVDAAGGLSRRVLGVKLGQDSTERAARTTARVDGGIVTITVAMSVLYPSSARQTAGRVREHVIDRVASLTGLDVKYVDIEVTRLLPAPITRRRVR